PKKYVVLNSGFTYREYDYLNNARQVAKLPDWAVVDIKVPVSSRAPGGIVAAGVFGGEWGMKGNAKEGSVTELLRSHGGIWCSIFYSGTDKSRRSYFPGSNAMRRTTVGLAAALGCVMTLTAANPLWACGYGVRSPLERFTMAEWVVVGKITTYEVRDVAALPAPGATAKQDFAVAVLEITNAIKGADGMTH